jgi:hypothetical protein
MKSNRDIYRATGLPLLQNRAFSSADDARACATGDVVLVQDLKTGLIFNEAFDPSLIDYDSEYQNEQGFSDVFRRHLTDVAKVVKRHFRDGSLIEIGCGKAYFLETLQRMGYTITGFDPAYEGNNPDVRREYFTSSVGLEASGIILRHVLEHVPDPVTFIEKIREANGGGGLLYIEVPCFDWICSHRAWFDIYYEHVNYFRLSDLQRMFGTIHEAGHTFGGQYLYIVADLATLTTPPQSGFTVADLPADFLDGVSRHARHLMRRREETQSRSAIWGAASKGVIFALFMERAGAPVDVAIDVNPAKQRRHLPVTGLCIDSPATAIAQLEPGSDVFVMNSNYLDEIKNLSGGRFTYLTV